MFQLKQLEESTHYPGLTSTKSTYGTEPMIITRKTRSHRRKVKWQSSRNTMNKEVKSADETMVITFFKINKVDTLPPANKTRNINVTTSVEKIIVNNINATNAIELDCIYSCVRKEMSTDLTHILTHLFQQYINRSIIPDEHLPSFEKNDRPIPSNYGPVLLTCITCILLEHIICSNLIQPFEDIINNRLHALRK